MTAGAMPSNAQANQRRSDSCVALAAESVSFCRRRHVQYAELAISRPTTTYSKGADTPIQMVRYFGPVAAIMYDDCVQLSVFILVEVGCVSACCNVPDSVAEAALRS